MSIAAEKVVEMLALPEQDRAYLARQLIASLDDTVDADAETQWHAIIDRRSREIEEGKVSCRPVEQVVQDVRASKPRCTCIAVRFTGRTASRRPDIQRC